MRQTTITVIMVTYNQSATLRQALDSILMQEHDYKMEIIVGDDCSKDNTSMIMSEYVKKFPETIHYIRRNENVGPTKNYYDIYINCTGDYIALLEGDDFWTDPHKLAYQVSFLDQHPEYIACTHRYSVVDDLGNIIEPVFRGQGRPSDGKYTIHDFEKYIYFGHTGTLVFRNIFRNPEHDYSILYKAHYFVGDITLCLILSCIGDSYVMKENMASYRSVQKKGGTNFSSIIAKRNMYFERYTYLRSLEQYCADEFHITLKHENRMPFYIWWSILFVIRYPSKHNWQCLRSFFRLRDPGFHLYFYILGKVFSFPVDASRHFMRKLKKKIIRSQAAGKAEQHG